MSRWMAGLLMLLALALSPGIALATAIGEPLAFDSEAQRQQYETLTRELRCTVCQSETIHESNAELAADMRHHEVDDGLGGHAVPSHLVDAATHIGGELGVGLVDRLALAHGAAQLSGQRLVLLALSLAVERQRLADGRGQGDAGRKRQGQQHQQACHPAAHDVLLDGSALRFSALSFSALSFSIRGSTSSRSSWRVSGPMRL